MMGDFRKADEMLQDALRQAHGGERLRAIVQVGPDARMAGELTEFTDPSMFSTRVAWQKARIAEQKGKVAEATRSTREELASLNVRVLGGELSGTMVIEGTADQIASSLELPGITRASLDRPLAVELGAADE